MGHSPRIMPQGNLDFGSAQLIERLESADGSAAYVAGSDHRRDGQAVAY